MNDREKGLLFCTVVIVAVDIALALCICLILPLYMCVPTQVSKKMIDDGDGYSICQCAKLIPIDVTMRDVTMHEPPPTSEPTELTNKIPKDSTLPNADKAESVTPKQPPAPPPKQQKLTLERFRKKRDTSRTQLLESFPYLVSLQISAYNDAPEKILAGMGTIMNAKYFLTASTNVIEPSEWKNVSVRAGTPYWHAYGSTYTISKHHPSPDYNIVLIEIENSFRFSPVLQEIKYPYRSSWKHVHLIGWPVDMYNKNIRERTKLQPFSVTNWTSLSCVPPVINYICFELDQAKCDSVSGSPLISSCGEFVGMKMIGGKCDEFLNVKKRTLKIFLGKFLSSAPHAEEMALESKHCQELYLKNCKTTSVDTSCI